MAETGTSLTRHLESRSDPFVAGTIASILGVAGAGFRLSLILNAISCEIVNAGFEVHGISKGVTLFSTMLKQTGVVLQAADSVHSNEAIETARSIADEGTRVFDEIHDMLDRLGTKSSDGNATPSLQQRFRWCFKKNRVTYLMAQLESLKLSLAVMLQVIQLGQLMASTSRRDPPEEVAVKTEAIKQERLEAQNAVIVRYWQMSKMDRVFEASRREEEDDRRASIDNEAAKDDELKLVSTNESVSTYDPPPPEYAPSSALIKLPVFSLGELDQTLHKIKGSPKEMIQVSDQAIDPLLERWTNWREVRERRHQRDSGGRYAPSVQHLNEEDEEMPYHERFRERDDISRGYYLEGTTTDWRKPNSSAARHEAYRRRKRYENYQPSVSAASSDVEDSPGSASSKRRVARHHVIDSSSESSASEADVAKPKPRRRSSGAGHVQERRISIPEGAPITHAHTTVQPPTWATSNSANNTNRPLSATPGQSTASGLLSPAYHSPGHRPWASPDQNMGHHSLSTPIPALHTANNAPNPYSNYSTYGNAVYPQYPVQSQLHPPSPYLPPSSPQSRYLQQPTSRMGLPPRPVSQDGKQARSPSRLSSHSATPRSHGRGDGDKRHAKEKSTKQNLKESATKGLLGAGAIAGFLEALEGLSL
ncbi:hypothetical protein PV08_03651 [Exophiala spinifera]|uniref:Fungal N-terminal domain-containing protein n=1 Tax=Exophiala spinifera TaxID=91928 RepID=A0A0D1YVP3_9EURO|nr:uncharacterized protein PV08_03651 [Exophiala spinifera]KIW19356.1 hypothetical protein PV08_03651 [Exophiala spinifera]